MKDFSSTRTDLKARESDNKSVATITISLNPANIGTIINCTNEIIEIVSYKQEEIVS